MDRLDSAEQCVTEAATLRPLSRGVMHARGSLLKHSGRFYKSFFLI